MFQVHKTVYFININNWLLVVVWIIIVFKLQEKTDNS